MKNACKLIASLALALALLCCASLCLADGAQAPEVLATGGDALTNVTFFVNSRGNAQVTLMQPEMGAMRMVSTANSIDALSRSMYGRYRVTYTDGVDSGEVDFNAQVCTLTLSRQGTYTVRVVPYTPENFHEGEENFTPYLLNRYTGAYYKESGWITAPTWTINRASNCTCTATGSAVTAQPAAQNAALVIYYRTVDGGLLSSEIRPLTPGTHTVYAAYSRSGYTQVGTSYYTVTAYSNGTLSAPSVTFYFTKTATPVPAVTQPKLTVYYRTVDGGLLSSETRTLTVGTNYVYSGFSKSGYALVGSTFYTVTAYSNGTLSTPSVTFYFTKTVTPTPTPASAALTIYYRTVEGALLSSETRILPVGTNYVYSNYSKSGYVLVGNTYYSITVYSNGTMSAASVTFYYNKSATPTPTPATAALTIYYRTVEGALLSSETRVLPVGTNYVYSNYSKSGYVLVGNTYYTVTVYSNGTMSAASVTFYYNKSSTPVPTPTPTPQVSAALTVYYRTVDGELLSSETRTLGIGTHTVYSNYSNSNYVLTGESSYSVTVYGENSISTPSVTFYYNRKATPTPKATAKITVYYRLEDGTLLSQETRALEQGQQYVFSNFQDLNNYWLAGNSYYIVTANGSSVSQDSVTFYYKPRTAELGPNDQYATISAEKIYPRRGPFFGKNEKMYAAQGQTVIVHSKARSTKEHDDSWWVCFSGELRCWGQTFVLDHMWIRFNYFSSKSFDLELLPVDPEWPDT